ncbi:MAG: hypothetical protein C0519_10185 [Hyphomicrobium sp.]|nr:hypothetical protein [Hyphomicrobium sp.]PPD08699.1 MAG: hypothetical protein CTY28_04795 [Hyphomicrobium sp.]
MKIFELKLDSPGHQPSIGLTADRARDIVEANRSLIHAIDQEELYDAVISDYIEFESALLTTSVEQTCRPILDQSTFDELRLLYNRRLAHLLSLGRSYIDTQDKNVIAVLGEQSTASMKAARQIEFERSLGYRAIDALRNATQHYGLPLQGLTIGFTWSFDPAGKKDQRAHYVVPYLNLSQMRRDNGFKKKILAELIDRGERIDIRPMTREYVEGISNIHNEFRSIIQLRVLEAELVVQKAINDWRQVTSQTEDANGLAVTSTVSNQANIESYISEPTLRRLQHLTQKNRAPLKLAKSYASNSSTLA